MTASTVSVSRTVAATPERVYAAWSEPEQLAEWWWPQLAGTTYDLDVRLGGAFRIHAPAAGLTVSGRYTEVEPPRRMAFTWDWADGNDPDPADNEGQDHVIVTFEPVAGGTRVTVAHASTDLDVDGNLEQGWNDVMDRLAASW